MANRVCIGVEVSKTEAVIACLKKSITGLKTIHMATEPLPADRSLKDRVTAALHTARGLSVEWKCRFAPLYLVLPPEAGMVKTVEYPAAVRDNLRETIGYDLETHIPLPAEQVVFDLLPIPAKGRKGRIRMLFAATRRGIVEAATAAAPRVSDGLAGVEMRFTATANYMARHPSVKSPPNFAFVYSENGGWEMGFVLDRKPIGCLRFRPDSAGGELAEQIAQFRESMGIAGGKWKLYLPEDELDGGLLSHLRQTTGMETLPYPAGKNGRGRKAAAAEGSTLRGFFPGLPAINLMPASAMKRKKPAGRFTTVFLLVLAAAALLTYGAVTIRQNREIDRRLTAEIEALRPEVEAVKRLKRRMETLEDRIADWRNTTRRTPVLSALRELTMRIPKTDWLRELTIDDDKVSLEGISVAAGELIRILEDAPLFENVSFLSGISRGRDDREQFRIGLTLNPENDGVTRQTAE